LRATSKSLALIGVLACGLIPGIALAQDPSTTTTDTLSGYTSTLPTVTTPPTTTTTTPAEEPTPTPTTTSEVAGEVESGGDEPTTDGAAAPASSVTPPQSTPATLAFTGADAILLLLLGATLAGSALWLLRRGDRSS